MTTRETQRKFTKRTIPSIARERNMSVDKLLTELYAEHRTLREVGIALGVDKSTVSREMKRQNIGRGLVPLGEEKAS